MAQTTDIYQLANLMEDYAKQAKALLPPEHQAIIDALVMAETLKKGETPHRLIVSKLRGAVLQHQSKSIVLSSFMELLANQLEQQRTQ